MIAAPLNDRGCLEAVTQVVVDMVERRDPALVDLAARFSTTRALAAWIRSLPQRDDMGAPHDQPKVEACEPPQRLRIPADDPNCVERAALYLGAAELIDGSVTRRLATIEVPGGLHTLAVEDGAPVVLDPRVRRNVAQAGVFRLGRRRNGNAPVELTPAQAIDWIADLAMEPARHFAGGLVRVEVGRAAMHALLNGAAIAEDDIAHVAFVLALADHEARLFGRPGEQVLRTTARALDELDGAEAAAPRNAGPGLRFGRTRVRPNKPLLGALARVGGRVGYQIGVAAMREKLAAMGVAAPLLMAVESELNREGLTLGAIAAPPPMPGTLAAVAPTTVLGRTLSARL